MCFSAYAYTLFYSINACCRPTAHCTNIWKSLSCCGLTADETQTQRGALVSLFFTISTVLLLLLLLAWLCYLHWWRRKLWCLFLCTRVFSVRLAMIKQQTMKNKPAAKNLERERSIHESSLHVLRIAATSISSGGLCLLEGAGVPGKRGCWCACLSRDET